MIKVYSIAAAMVLGILATLVLATTRPITAEDAARIATGFLARTGIKRSFATSDARTNGVDDQLWRLSSRGADPSGTIEIRIDKFTGVVQQYVHGRMYKLEKEPNMSGHSRFPSSEAAKKYLIDTARRAATRWPLTLESWEYLKRPGFGTRQNVALLSGKFWQRHYGYPYLSGANTLGVVIDPRDGLLIYVVQRYVSAPDPPRIKITQQQAIQAVRKYLAGVGARTKLTTPAKPVVLGYTVPWEQFGGPKSTDRPPYRGRLAYEIWVSESSSRWVDAETGKILGGNTYSPTAGK